MAVDRKAGKRISIAYAAPTIFTRSKNITALMTGTLLVSVSRTSANKQHKHPEFLCAVSLVLRGVLAS